MTEELARTKWCPMMRSSNSGQPVGVTVNNLQEAYFSINCIASACMMWRADDPTYTGYSSSTGYCGLAGKL